MTTSERARERSPDELRPVTLERGISPFAEGSCRISAGETRVVCTATVEERVPHWRRGAGAGWVTAEYAMLPRATQERTTRERGRIKGRTQEIQRLIGRSLRACMNLEALGERQIILDCDVLVADGGTRTAAITGAAVALHDACAALVARERVASNPMRELVAAISVGIVDGRPTLDLAYEQDVAASVDMNVVALESGGLVEVQGTAEEGSYGREELDALIDLAEHGIRRLLEIQREALG